MGLHAWKGLAHGVGPADAGQSAARHSPAREDGERWEVAGANPQEEAQGLLQGRLQRGQRPLAQPVAWGMCRWVPGGPAGEPTGRACSLHSASLGLPSGPWLEPGDLMWMSYAANPPGPGSPPSPRDRKLHQPGARPTPAVAT